MPKRKTATRGYKSKQRRRSVALGLAILRVQKKRTSRGDTANAAEIELDNLRRKLGLVR